MIKTLCIGIAGLGTVGSGLVEMLQKNQDDILRRTGCKIVVKAIAIRDLSKKRAVPEGIRLIDTPLDLAEDPEIDVVVELIGGTALARKLILSAIEHGKSVVTANKALLAEYGREVFGLAHRKNAAVGYEASVAGAIPVIQTLKNSLAGNHISSVIGILNGTSNYILSEMSSRGFDFPVALAAAQKMGYAEADPSLDIDGFDAAHKLTLLIRLAWGVHYPFSSLFVQGIRNISSFDMQLAREFGYQIKLIGKAEEVGGKIKAGVYPALVKESMLLARVDGAYNAISIKGNASGPLFLHGLGAGKLPTASSVLGDLLALAKRHQQNSADDNTGFANALLDAVILPEDDAVNEWYVRATVRDNPGVLRDIASVFAQEGISFAQLIQKEKQDDKVALVFMTHETTTSAIRTATQQLEHNGTLVTPATCYRILSSE